MSYIAHCFGESYDKAKEWLKSNCSNVLQIDPRISIISVMNKECYDNSILVKQCAYNSILLNIPSSLLEISSEQWINTLKIEGIINELIQISTEYVLILDGYDTCILKNLDSSFIQKFNDMKCDISFNYQLACYPSEFFKKTKVHHLNAGVCFGKRNALLKFYQECASNNKEYKYISKYNNKPSEQYIVKLTALNSDLKINIDSQGQLFYTSSFLQLKERIKLWNKKYQFSS